MAFSSLPSVLMAQADRLGTRSALRFKKYGLFHTFSWQDYADDAWACATALASCGIAFGDRVGLLSENRLEWLLGDMGIMTAGAINVPLHAPLTAQQIQFQLAETEAKFAFVSTAAQLEKLKQVLHELPALQGIVTFDGVSSSPNDNLLGSNVNLMSWDGFLQKGRNEHNRLAAEIAGRVRSLNLDSLATIMYTSGTTGNPKGVMLTHGNLLSNATASLKVQPLDPEDLVLNWLPLSHIYARTVDYYETMIGGIELVLAESAETVIENIQEVQPTHVASVPRLYEKILAACATPDPEMTKKRVRAIFGRRIKRLSSGGAALPVPIETPFQNAGLPLYQGYGLTESSPVISFNRPDANRVGTVGLPLPGVEIKIGPDGEVLARGPNIMKGYWRNPQASAEALHDGWLLTGDLGKIDADGFLSITGRKKELMVLSNGKKLIPSFVEGLLVADDCIDQAAIFGEGKNYLSALIVPQWDLVRKTLREQGNDLASISPNEMTTMPEVVNLLRQRIDKRLAEVSPWEQVKKFVILSEPFSIAKEELTVSLKLRREVVVAHNAKTLEALYSNNSKDASD